MFPALLKVSLRRQQIENIRSFTETIPFFSGTKFHFEITLATCPSFSTCVDMCKDNITLTLYRTHASES